MELSKPRESNSFVISGWFLDSDFVPFKTGYTCIFCEVDEKLRTPDGKQELEI